MDTRIQLWGLMSRTHFVIQGQKARMTFQHGCLDKNIECKIQVDPLSELRKKYFENLDSKHISTQCTHSPLCACTTCSTICSTGCCTTCGTWSYIYNLHCAWAESTFGKVTAPWAKQKKHQPMLRLPVQWQHPHQLLAMP